jgi:hypothetical protein
MKSLPILIFLHLPKTAGSTLARILQHQYPAGSIISLYDSMLGEELAAIPPSQLGRLRVVMGHLYFGAHTYLSRPSTYVTMLRDPVNRVISHYYYVRQDSTHYLYDYAQKMGLKEYIETCNRHEPNNDQTRLLAGKRDTRSFGMCSDEMLDIAKKNLIEYFAVVGITEDFDRSLMIMKRNLGWRMPFYISENVGQRRLRREYISVETLGVIQAHNFLDIELYRFAKDLLQEQVRSQGLLFENELDRFKKLNHIYKKIWSLLPAARKVVASKFPLGGRMFINHE